MSFPKGWMLVAVVLCGCSHPRHSAIAHRSSSTIEERNNSERPLQAGESFQMLASCNAYPSVTIALDSDGDATFLCIGKVRLAGLSLAEAKRKVERLYVDQGYYRHFDLRFTRR
jgi:hypothetical protein